MTELDKKTVKSARIGYEQFCEWVRYHKKYWVSLTVESSSRDGAENTNHHISDETVVELLNMKRTGKKPISFTAAYKHSWMLYMMNEKYCTLVEYCEKHNRYIIFGTKELTIRQEIERYAS